MKEPKQIMVANSSHRAQQHTYMEIKKPGYLYLIKQRRNQHKLLWPSPIQMFEPTRNSQIPDAGLCLKKKYTLLIPYIINLNKFINNSLFS